MYVVFHSEDIVKVAVIFRSCRKRCFWPPICRARVYFRFGTCIFKSHPLPSSLNGTQPRAKPATCSEAGPPSHTHWAGDTCISTFLPAHPRSQLSPAHVNKHSISNLLGLILLSNTLISRMWRDVCGY